MAACWIRKGLDLCQDTELGKAGKVPLEQGLRDQRVVEMALLWEQEESEGHCHSAQGSASLEWGAGDEE